MMTRAQQISSRLSAVFVNAGRLPRTEVVERSPTRELRNFCFNGENLGHGRHGLVPGGPVDQLEIKNYSHQIYSSHTLLEY